MRRGPIVLAAALLGAATACAPPDSGHPNAQSAPPGSVLVPTGGDARRLYYVPIYSHIYYRDPRSAFDLAATLSVRNTDPEHGLHLTRADYYDTRGRPLRAYLAQPRQLGPLETAEFVVPARDTAGGSGANFLVELSMDSAVTEPVVEAVMVGINGTAGVSFVSPGRLLRRP